MVDATTTSEPQSTETSNSQVADVTTVGTKNVPKPEPNPLVICGPSGSGKSTILKNVMSQQKYKDMLAFSVSHTTRQPRAGEEHGREYYFSNRESMLADIEAGKFIESAEYSGNLYGTSKESVHKCKSQGKICVLDIDSQGVRSLKKVSNLSPVYVFVKPPCMAALEERLRSRKTETEESLKKRLDAAREEIAFGEEEGAFDALIINDDLEAAVKQLTAIIDNKILHETTMTAKSTPMPAVSPNQDQGGGDSNDPTKNEADDVGGKRPKLDEAVESSRDSTPGVER